MLPEFTAAARVATGQGHPADLLEALKDLPRQSADAFRQWDWRHLAFYGGVPLVLALYTTLNNWELLRQPGFLGSFAFHTAHSTIPWWLNASACWLLFSLVPWLARHRAVLIVTGTTIASLAMLPYADAVATGFESYWAVPGLQPASGAGAPADPIDGYLMYFVRAAVLTLGVNWIFDRYLGLPRYRRAGTPAAPDASPEPAQPSLPMQPRFLDRLPEAVTLADVLAIKAEQHYIRVYAGGKSWLTLYRFSDALAELADQPGLQVHRSYWVRPDFVAKIRRGSGRLTVVLRSGLEVPVSGPYKGLVNRLARENRLPVLPLTD